MRAGREPRLLDQGLASRRDRHDDVGAAHGVLKVGGRLDRVATFELRLHHRAEVVERRLAAAPDTHLVPLEDRVAGLERAFGHVAGADDREDLRLGARHPLGGHGRRGAGALHRVVRAVADRERKARFGVGVDQDREDGGEVELVAVVLADRDPLARRGLGLLDVGRHGLPLARVLIEDDVALRIHVVAALAMHAVGLLDPRDVFGRREQAHHVVSAQDQGLLAPPALHAVPPRDFASLVPLRGYIYNMSVIRQTFSGSRQISPPGPSTVVLWPSPFPARVGPALAMRAR